MNQLLQTRVFAELDRELARARKRARTAGGLTEVQAIFDRYRTVYGVRPNTFRRWQRTQNGTRRGDAGKLRKAAAYRPLIEAIFRLQCELSDFEGGRWIAAELTLREAARRGLIAAGEAPPPPPVNGGEQIPALTVRNYNLWVQKLGLKKPRGFTRFQAEFSNQVQQLDVTGSPYLEVAEPLPGGDFLLRRRTPRSRLSKTQKSDGLRLWLAGITDDYSGLAAVQYTVARGESAVWVREFLDRVWRGLDERLPLRGLPDVLYCDNGPFARNEETRPYLSAEMGVGVELVTHEPYRARSTGKIERLWRTVKGNFETGFLSGRDTWLLSEINTMAVEWAITQGQRPHRQEKSRRRADVYLRGLPGAVRLPAADAMQNAFRTFTRVVDGSGVFTLENQPYRVGPELRQQRVLVYRNAAGEVAVECPATGQRAIAALYTGPQPWQEFESFAETETERTAKRRERGEWGDSAHPWAADGRVVEPATAGGAARRITLIPQTTEPAKATPFAVAAAFADGLEAKKWIARELGVGLLTLRDHDPELWRDLNGLLNQTLKREEIAAWASGVRATWDAGQAESGGGR